MPFEEAGHSFEPGDDEHDTPESFFQPLHDILNGFDLDPAASDTSDLADRNVTKDEDGMSMDWWGDVWLNPPYSEVGDWLDYGERQVAAGNVENLVALVYARTGTQWFHNNAVYADLMCLVEGRLTFGNGDYSAPAPSMVLVWGPAATDQDLREHLAHEVGFMIDCEPEKDTQQGVLRHYA